MWKRLCISLLAFGGLASCTVKEDRAECPCRLSVLIVDGRAEKTPLTFAVSGAKTILEERLSGGSAQLVDAFEIPRGLWQSFVYAGLSEGRLQGAVARIPQGMASDPLYAGASALDATGEEVSSQLDLHKQYAAVTLDLREFLTSEAGVELVARGNVNGMDLALLAPVKGPFECALEPVEDRVYRFLAPRQLDASLELGIVFPGEPEYTFPLGAAIAGQGYDWTAADLQDITLALSLAQLDFGIDVRAWEEVGVN